METPQISNRLEEVNSDLPLYLAPPFITFPTCKCLVSGGSGALVLAFLSFVTSLGLT